jgi:hypothetical protein
MFRKISISNISLLILIFAPSWCLGQITFQKSYGGYSQDFGSCIAITRDSGYIICGESSSYPTAGVGGGTYVIKLDAFGTIQWTRALNNGIGYYVYPTSDQGYIVSGGVEVPQFGADDIHLFKLDSSGNIVWERAYGGSGAEWPFSACPTSDGGYIVIGVTYTFGPGPGDIYIVKTDSIGNLMWSKNYGGAGQDQGSSILQNPDGSYMFSANSSALTKIDSLGNPLWSKHYTSPDGGFLNISRRTSDNGYILLGFISANYSIDSIDVYLVKTDSLGNPIWGKSYGGNKYDRASDVIETSDGGYIIGGKTKNTTNDYDLFAIKTNSLGDTLWTMIYGDSDNDQMNGSGTIVQTADNGYAITGYTVNYNTYYENIYLIKTDSSGRTYCNEHCSSMIVNDISLHGVDVTIQASTPATITTIINTANTTGGLVYNFCAPVEVSETEKVDADFSIYPNPAHRIITLSQLPADACEVKISDVAGRFIYKLSVANQTSQTIDCPFPPGIYFVSLIAGDRIVNRKLVIQ